ncbi:hypothetical protein [Streptomyces sp. NPDC094437]|uniref:hypothetical protein n=1 Tax=Streptomyces sp. NPDC094437 TaxID=3366060 RepID=UPI00381594FE
MRWSATALSVAASTLAVGARSVLGPVASAVAAPGAATCRGTVALRQDVDALTSQCAP